MNRGEEAIRSGTFFPRPLFYEASDDPRVTGTDSRSFAKAKGVELRWPEEVAKCFCWTDGFGSLALLFCCKLEAGNWTAAGNSAQYLYLGRPWMTRMPEWRWKVFYGHGVLGISFSS